MHPKDLSIADFTYSLPVEKIAVYPLHPRDRSKLLIYRNENITQDVFSHLSHHLPKKSYLVFNDTRVIRARILFQKPTGATIEVFCLEPYGNFADYTRVMAQSKSTQWKCMIGGAGKWKHGPLTKTFLIGNQEINLYAHLTEKLADAYVVELSWRPEEYSFGEILARAGVTPLPPYIHRKAEEQDVQDYQTIYSAHDGSVAAPTAGLHFTEQVFRSLEERNIDTSFLTLHVGAGTFKPVKSPSMEGHVMHAEWLDVTPDFLKDITSNAHKSIICVGTTSIRCLESLYWLGVKVNNQPNIDPHLLHLDQWSPYEASHSPLPSAAGSMNTLIDFMKRHQLERLFCTTELIIAPGYEFRMASGLITNFHQPQSTLLLLVAAMAGKGWKKVYEYALANDFRFLSYGDSCLILGEEL